MKPDNPSVTDEPWYSARCFFCQERSGRPNTYEERVILIRAEGWDQAFQIAEDEAKEYAARGEGWSYTGFVELFHLFESTIGDRSEIFSLIRSSDLGESEFIDRYYDDGSEHSQRVDSDS